MAADLTTNAVTSSPPPAAQIAATGGAMSVEQCCEYINVRRTKFYAEVNSGRLELRKIGSKSVVFRSEAERWLHALPTMTETEELDRKAKPRKPRRSTSDVADEPPARAGSDLGHQGDDLDGERAQ